MATRPTILLDPASDTSPIGDGLTNESTITLRGIGGVGDTITVLDDTFTSYGTAVVNDQGNWFLTVTVADGGYTFQAVSGLNTSDTMFSDPFQLEVDAFIEQEIPTLFLKPDSDSGIAGDLLTNDATPTFTGTGTFGATVELVSGFTSYGTSAVGEDGTWTITATSLPEGEITLNVISRAQGNDDLFSEPVTITIDQTAPSAPTFRLEAGSDTGASSTDGLSANTQPTFSGEAENGSVVTLYDTNGGVLGSSTAVGGTWSITPSTALAEGEHSLTARAVDAAGNTSVASSVASLTIDTTAPTLSITSAVSELKAGETTTITFSFSEDPGSSFTWDGASGDVVVSGGTLSAISGSGLIRTATFTPDANTNVGTASITVAASSYADVAGNTGGAGATPVLTFDTKLPSAPSNPDLAAASDTGISDADDVTNDTTPTLTGTAEADSTVTIYNGMTEIGTVTADESGNYSFTPAVALSEGAYAFSATATDAAGNVSAASSPTAVIVDSSAPTVVVAIEDSSLNFADRASTVTFTFSEAPVGFDISDIAAVNGSVSGLAATDDPLVYTATFTSLAEYKGVASVSVGNGYGDVAGNLGAGGKDTVSVNTFSPTDGADDLIGTAGPDEIAAGSGDDTVLAGLSNDVVYGNQGEDQLFGNEGSDTIYGGQDNDKVYGGQDDDYVEGNKGNDWIEGNKGDDVVLGNEGDDIVLGNQGDDWIHGGQGNDWVHGGQGNDFVFGGLGDDTLNGGLGDDVLEGGSGADIFVFAPNTGNDIITDFRFEEGDRIDLQGQEYVLGQNNEGQAALFLEDGGTVVLLGMTPDEFQGAFVA